MWVYERKQFSHLLHHITCCTLVSVLILFRPSIDLGARMKFQSLQSHGPDDGIHSFTVWTIILSITRDVDTKIDVVRSYF